MAKKFASFAVVVALAVVVQAKDNKFGPEFYALEILASQGHSLTAPVVQVVSCGEAIQLMVREGVDARAKFDLSKKDELPRAFRIRRRDGSLIPVIYVVRETQVYEMASKGHRQALLLLASAILHEDAHGDGAGEDQALEREAIFLSKQLFNVSPEERHFLAERIAFIQRLARETSGR